MMFKICLVCLLFLVGGKLTFAQGYTQLEKPKESQSFIEFCFEDRLTNSYTTSAFQNYGQQRRRPVSVERIVTELVVGSLAGFVVGGLMYEISKPKNKEENFIGVFGSAALIASAALLATSAGVYLIGTIDEEGSYWKTVLGASFGAAVFSLVARSLTANPDTRLWIMAIGLPIGATAAFNVTRGGD